MAGYSYLYLFCTAVSIFSITSFLKISSRTSLNFFSRFLSFSHISYYLLLLFDRTSSATSTWKTMLYVSYQWFVHFPQVMKSTLFSKKLLNLLKIDKKYSNRWLFWTGGDGEWKYVETQECYGEFCVPSKLQSEDRIISVGLDTVSMQFVLRRLSVVSLQKIFCIFRKFFFPGFWTRLLYRLWVKRVSSVHLPVTPKATLFVYEHVFHNINRGAGDIAQQVFHHILSTKRE